jgi:hypothetical protein
MLRIDIYPKWEMFPKIPTDQFGRLPKGEVQEVLETPQTFI